MFWKTRAVDLSQLYCIHDKKVWLYHSQLIDDTIPVYIPPPEKNKMPTERRDEILYLPLPTCGKECIDGASR